MSRVRSLSSPSVTDLQRAENKLLQCSIMLGSQIRKKQIQKFAPKILLDGGSIAAIATSTTHLTTTLLTYYRNMQNLKDTQPFASLNDHTTCDQAYQILRSLRTYVSNSLQSDYIDGVIFGKCDMVNKASFTQACLTDAYKFLQDYMRIAIPADHGVCADAVNPILDGPGMWKGYMPVLIIFGLVIPALLLGTDLYFNYSQDLLKCLIDKGLPLEKSQTIEKYASEFGILIPESSSLTDIKAAFDFKLGEIRRDLIIARSASLKNTDNINQPVVVVNMPAGVLLKSDEEKVFVEDSKNQRYSLVGMKDGKRFNLFANNSSLDVEDVESSASFAPGNSH